MKFGRGWFRHDTRPQRFDTGIRVNRWDRRLSKLGSRSLYRSSTRFVVENL